MKKFIIFSLLLALILFSGWAITKRTNPTQILNLPPDPGKAGKTTIAGIDSDNDGIRDDIQRYIAINYPDSQKTQESLKQLYTAHQNALTNSADTGKAMTNASKIDRAIECFYYIHSEDIDTIDVFLKKFLNTGARKRAYFEFQSKLYGQVFKSQQLSKRKFSCTFDPDRMEN